MGDLAEVIKRIWGFDALRPLQEDAMRATLHGRDVMLVLPTGGGKSLCFQAPAVVDEGTTVVISPLISLMKDQVDGLRSNGVRAAMVNSAMEDEDRVEALVALRQRTLDLVYVAPERLAFEGFLDALAAASVTRFVVDEAHCISHWGHDFRDDYRRLGALRRRFPDVPFFACTATATERVRSDVAAQLALRDPVELVGSFDRPNLTYRFRPRHDRIAQVMEVVRSHEAEAGIVYALRRTDVDRIASELQARGVSALPYHAGLDDAVRKANQEAFLEERCDVVVATVAFGMGIDRPDVRYVLHAAMPKSIEHYLQESGRAGRDGMSAECVLLWSGADWQGWRSLIAQGGAHEDSEPAVRRLDQMYRMASGTTCRHRALVEHFGQRLGNESCAACDVCLGEIPELAEATVVAQKILSCIHRVDQRFGASHVADVLRGANTDKIRRVGHDQVSTYGLLSELDLATVRGAIDQLVALGYVSVSDGQYPTLGLLEASRDVLRGDQQVRLLAAPVPAKRTRKRRLAASSEAEKADLSPGELALFEDLRALRKELAAERGVPPYLIFPDRALVAMAQQRPTSPELFLDVKGVGEKKAADLGPVFLERICGFAAEAE